jgi:hypothetical protein
LGCAGVGVRVRVRNQIGHNFQNWVNGRKRGKNAATNVGAKVEPNGVPSETAKKNTINGWSLLV